jgi:hypothetical protein
MSIEEVTHVSVDGYISSREELERDWEAYGSDRTDIATIQYDRWMSAASFGVHTVTQEERSTGTTHERHSGSGSRHWYTTRSTESQGRTARNGPVEKITQGSSHGGENRQIKAIRQPSQEVCDVCSRRKVKCNVKDFCLHRKESERPTDVNT